MTETERQFRDKGWTRAAASLYIWKHERYGTMILDPSHRDEMMDAWLCGFAAGKEAGDE